MGRFIIDISKEYLKFSAAHFTIFSDSSLELLHGHNYYVALRLEAREADNGLVLDFKLLKDMLRRVCDELDEKILLPMESPLLKISRHEGRFVVTFHGAGFKKTYEFPCEDVMLLPLDNVTCESLARYACEEFIKHFGTDHQFELANVISIAVSVEETRGQSVSYIWDN